MVVNKEESHKACVIGGIPQGTVLGPLLFVTYINDLLDSGFLYADDTKMFWKISSKDDVMSLQADIKKVEDWTDA